MSEYQLEIKQIVDYPRCRIYRQFIRTLMEDRNIRVSGGSGLFYYVVLCSYANFRTSYRRLDGINYTIYPGEWVCRLSELRNWFRVPFQNKATAILEKLQKQGCISYSLLGRGNIIKFRIKGWRQHNTVLDYNAPCQKDTGFFFLPISVASELISTERCSEMDCMLDLWVNAIYNDTQVLGSEIGPVVYMRNGTGNPLVSYSELAERWGLSKATVSRLMKRLKEKNYISLVTFSGSRGSAIYLQSYLSTMFQISDVMINKEEVAMALNIKIMLDKEEDTITMFNPKSQQSGASKKEVSVSESGMESIVEKVKEVFAAQGFSCSNCPKFRYKLYSLSDDCTEKIHGSESDSTKHFLLSFFCDQTEIYRCDLKLKPAYRPIQGV